MVFHVTGIIIGVGLKWASSELEQSFPGLSVFKIQLNIHETNSSLATKLPTKGHPPTLTHLGGSPAKDMGELSVALPDFLARVLLPTSNTQKQITPRC